MKVAGFKVVNKTEKAWLLKHKKKGDFWVPKALVQDDTIWGRFIPIYLPKDEIDNVMIPLEAEEAINSRIKVQPKKVVVISTPIESDDWFVKDFLGVR